MTSKESEFALKMIRARKKPVIEDLSPLGGEDMNKEIDLSGQWLEAWRLRNWSKGKVAQALDKKIGELEEGMFQQADQRIDSFYERKRRNNPQSGKGSA